MFPMVKKESQMVECNKIHACKGSDKNFIILIIYFVKKRGRTCKTKRQSMANKLKELM